MKKDIQDYINNAPRRIRVDLYTPEEILIREAMLAVEKLGADPLLTDCVMKLSDAKEKLSDYVDKLQLEDKVETLSECCGVKFNQDIKICPDCKEHCE